MAHFLGVGWDLVKEIHKSKLSLLYRRIPLHKVKDMETWFKEVETRQKKSNVDPFTAGDAEVSSRLLLFPRSLDLKCLSRLEAAFSADCRIQI
jgi:hypothetical protein